MPCHLTPEAAIDPDAERRWTGAVRIVCAVDRQFEKTLLNDVFRIGNVASFS